MLRWCSTRRQATFAPGRGRALHAYLAGAGLYLIKVCVGSNLRAGDRNEPITWGSQGHGPRPDKGEASEKCDSTRVEA